jgi:hypothetical protein
VSKEISWDRVELSDKVQKTNTLYTNWRIYSETPTELMKRKEFSVNV